ncbi:MAG: YadA-like family protein [Patescibacteria group bacterium]|nr:YadA-like family protein [bacterium]MDZ4240591.1 YadA-like family protein [Patescibacteria group bacterium]
MSDEGGIRTIEKTNTKKGEGMKKVSVVFAFALAVALCVGNPAFAGGNSAPGGNFKGGNSHYNSHENKNSHNDKNYGHNNHDQKTVIIVQGADGKDGKDGQSIQGPQGTPGQDYDSEKLEKGLATVAALDVPHVDFDKKFATSLSGGFLRDGQAGGLGFAMRFNDSLQAGGSVAVGDNETVAGKATLTLQW